jgi:hypothetical protein
MSAAIKSMSPLVFGERKKLLDVSALESMYFHEFDVSADGKKFPVHPRRSGGAADASGCDCELGGRLGEDGEVTRPSRFVRVTDPAEVAVRFRLPGGVMNPMQVGRHDEVSERAIELRREPHDSKPGVTLQTPHHVDEGDFP